MPESCSPGVLDAKTTGIGCGSAGAAAPARDNATSMSATSAAVPDRIMALPGVSSGKDERDVVAVLEARVDTFLYHRNHRLQ